MLSSAAGFRPRQTQRQPSGESRRICAARSPYLDLQLLLSVAPSGAFAQLPFAHQYAAFLYRETNPANPQPRKRARGPQSTRTAGSGVPSPRFASCLRCHLERSLAVVRPNGVERPAVALCGLRHEHLGCHANSNRQSNLRLNPFFAIICDFQSFRKPFALTNLTQHPGGEDPLRTNLRERHEVSWHGFSGSPATGLRRRGERSRRQMDRLHLGA
jgi:hypothetical protein